MISTPYPIHHGFISAMGSDPFPIVATMGHNHGEKRHKKRAPSDSVRILMLWRSVTRNLALGQSLRLPTTRLQTLPGTHQGQRRAHGALSEGAFLCALPVLRELGASQSAIEGLAPCGSRPARPRHRPRGGCGPVYPRITAPHHPADDAL